jgi:hypothetical protein
MTGERGSTHATDDAASGINPNDAEGSPTFIGTINNNGNKNPIITRNQGSVEINY